MNEGCIQKLKHGSSKKLIKTGLPNHLWDQFFEFQALIIYHISNINYELVGEMPKTHTTGQTADISKIYDYSWYEWVKFCNQPITYLYLTVILVCYLGPSIDAENAMTYKILKEKGDYVWRTTVFLLNPTELACLDHKQLRNDFDASVAEALGPIDTISDFDYKEYTDLTPDIDYYDNFDEDGAKGIQMSLHHSLPP